MHSRKLLEASAAVVAVAAAVTFLSATPAAARQADEPNETIEVSPASGPPGTVITVSGEDCSLTDVGLVAVLVNLTGETPEIGDTEVHPDAGSWSAELTVPQTAAPGDEIPVTAACGYFGSPTSEFTLVFSYEPVTFDVTGVSTTAPPTTTPPTTTPPAPDAPAPAPPAEPVVADPTYTG